ncbi:hypothetical protein SUGI_0981160 [Cryptomeria japonica]|nr:hypothetical protein SUGI_0981160 [Cryptomeria japonica]
MEGKGFLFKPWKPNFNPLEEFSNIVPIWLKLPNLPQEYKDVETLRRIGNRLGEFVTAEEVVDKNNLSMFTRICINWQTIHIIPDIIEIKSGSGVWKQKLMFEEEMEFFSKCKVVAHPSGMCREGDKGKQTAQIHLVDEIIRLSKGHLWEKQWNEMDWEVLYSFKGKADRDSSGILGLGGWSSKEYYRQNL